MRAAEAIARETRPAILRMLAQDISPRLKADGSFVTDVDFVIEDLVRARLRAAFPDHGILGEERAPASGAAEYEWIVDPIDGTKSLRHGIPLFGTLLALRHAGEPVVGLIDLPMLSRTLVGASGVGAYADGRRVRLADVASADAVAREVIAIGERRQFAACGQAEVFDTLQRAHESVRTYCDCFGHALAIEGAAGAMVDYNLHVWDVAATEVLVREAGGLFRRVNQEAVTDRPGGRYDVIFGKPTVVEWVCRTLESAE